MMNLPKPLFCILAVLGLCASHALAEPRDGATAEAVKLIQAISPPHYVHSNREMLLHPERTYPDEVAKAKAQQAKDMENIPKLRKLLKVGANVFDYPGLLTRGILSYDEYATNGEYELWISATYAGVEGRILPYEFRLQFTNRGVITAINDVQWK